MIQEHSDLFVDPQKRNELLKRLSLFALTTGAGKTMLIVSVLLAINDEVLRRVGRKPRVGRVLYFVNERVLADQLEDELLTEVTRFGLHLDQPRVQVCSGSNDLARGGGYHDFTISCPHALWKRADRGDQDRAESEIQEILAKYDTIIWDECDFAQGQTDRLIRNAPHAMKFGLTATPIDAKGKFLDNFIVAYVASYRLVSSLDPCLKKVPAWDDGKKDGHVIAVPHSGYIDANGGFSEYHSGFHGDKDSLAGAMATITQAIEDAHKIEMRMRRIIPDDYYSPHILVRCNSVKQAENLAGQTERYLSTANFSTLGWRTSIMYAGVKERPVWERGNIAKKPLTLDEKRFVHPSGSERCHPWLAAKENRGRCTNRSARIIFLVDMGIRGMNNWTCQSIVDIKRADSLSNQIQLDGRAARLPIHLAKYIEIEDDRYKDFVTSRYYFPDCEGSSISSMEKARSLIHGMDALYEDSNLENWRDLLDGVPIGQNKKPKQPPEEAFTLGDRMQIDMLLGEKIEDGMSISDLAKMTEKEVDQIIDQLPPDITDDRRKSARMHIKRVLNDGEYRSDIVTIDPREPIRAILVEEPKSPDKYTNEELSLFVRNSPAFSENEKQFMDEIQAGNVSVKFLLGQMLHSQQEKHYQPPVTITKLSEVIRGTSAKINSSILSRPEFDSYFPDPRERFGLSARAVTKAIKTIFGVEDARNDGPLDQPGYHYKILSISVQREIRDLAGKYLIQWGVLPSVSALYREE